MRAGDDYATRPGRPDDADAIAAIYDAAIARGGATCDTSPVPSSVWHASLTDPAAVWAVAQRDDIVVGFCCLRPWSPRHGYRATREMTTYIASGHQRRGLGEALKRDILARAPAAGVHHIVSRIIADNRGSIRLNERLGFEVVGVQREAVWADERWQDVVMMQYVFGGRRQERVALTADGCK